jgi:hypothetical protein
MIRPQLIKLDEFTPRHIPPRPLTPQEIQSHTSLYMNIIVVGIIILGGCFLYYKLTSKDQEQRKYKDDVIELSRYL